MSAALLQMVPVGLSSLFFGWVVGRGRGDRLERTLLRVEPEAYFRVMR